jgi:hypothetical protein
MACPDRLSQWSKEVSMAFSHLSHPQVWGLALCGAAGITQISALLALVLQQQEHTVFQRLREWYLNAKQKSGKKRQELDVTSCFAPLLQWILRLSRAESQLVLALDATSLRKRWTVLSISVLVRGSAIPVAWKVVGGSEKGSWRPHWEGLLSTLGGCIPQQWQVLGLADRGLYAQWLFQAIVDGGWHPFLRINREVKARAIGEETFDWISRWVSSPGMAWKGEVECFAS